jgi:hypothetical protein
MYPHGDQHFIAQRGVSPRGFLERGRRSEETHERRPPELTAYAPRDALLVVAGNRLPANLGNIGRLRILGSGLTALRQGASKSPRGLWAWRPRDKDWLAAATQFPGTLFFNHSTFAALAHNLSASEADKMVWRPDFFGSVLFLVSSEIAISALGVGLRRPQLRDLPWWIAWLNMLGSVAFMVSAIAGFVVPSTDTVLDLPLDNAGTLIGAVCFLVGAALMLPAWRTAVRSRGGHPAK